MKYKNIVIIGSSGAIGRALVDNYIDHRGVEKIYTFARTNTIVHKKVIHHNFVYEGEESIVEAASLLKNYGPLDAIITTTGLLHNASIRPEKSINDISIENLISLFNINTILPLLIAKHFIPLCVKEKPSLFAALSARVGSITDNRLGGWYAYRASKAALNMMIKNLAIEMQRKYKQMVVVGLHPGTVDSRLSEPFQKNIQKNGLFTPQYAAEKLTGVIERLTITDSGHCFAWDGTIIPA